MWSLKKQTQGCMCGCFANTKGHEFVFQPNYVSCGQVKPSVLAGPLTTGTCVTFREPSCRLFSRR